MGPFGKKSPVKGIPDGAWGHLVTVHSIDVDTLSHELRTVERKGTINGGMAVTLLRVFRLKDATAAGVTVGGWETFDQHPELVLFEGYLTAENKAHLERKRP